MKKLKKQNDMDEFEQRLSRQSLRQLPADWRAEILASATRPVPRASLLSTLNTKLSALLWPCPQAWAGLAAIWIFIFVFNHSMQDGTPVVVAQKIPPPSPQLVAELKQQQQMFVELIGQNQPVEAEPPKFKPLPRSERVEFWMT
jgi:hypothetical protein